MLRGERALCEVDKPVQNAEELVQEHCTSESLPFLSCKTTVNRKGTYFVLPEKQYVPASEDPVGGFVPLRTPPRASMSGACHSKLDERLSNNRLGSPPPPLPPYLHVVPVQRFMSLLMASIGSIRRISPRNLQELAQA